MPHPTRVGHRWTFFGSCQQIQDVVFFYEKLTYSKTFGSTFTKKNQKLGIPQGVSDGHYMQKWPKMFFFLHIFKS